LAKAFVLTMFRKNADTPALFMHIQPDVNRLTREIKFATLIHGKSPFFRLDFVGNKIIAEILRLAFVFSDPLKGTLPVGEISTGGVESEEILAQRPQVSQGGPKDKISS
jgi:hypothetical protein